MLSRTRSVIVRLFFLVANVTFVVFETRPVYANGTIYTRSDGSIDPRTAPISTVDNITYTFTSDISDNSILIERDNIILNGAGFTLQGESTSGYSGIDLTGRTNVTIENIVISCARGISLADSSSNTISGNNIAPNYGNGIYLSNSSSNFVSGNNITANYGSCILLEYCSNNNTISENNIMNNAFIGIKITPNSFYNEIYHNNFMNNTSHASASGLGFNVWDDGSKGNYWSDSSLKYPNANETDDSGVWNTPYTVDGGVDRYPLVNAYAIPEFPTVVFLPLLMIVTLLAIIVYKRRNLTRAL
jgi:parallel beta-helix repeat protein